MPASTEPRFTIKGNYSTDGAGAMQTGITAASADYDGSTGNYTVAFTAGPNGSRLAGLHFEAKGTNVQTVARILINNGNASGTAANNSLVGKITLPATTAAANSAELSADYSFPGVAADLPAGYRVLVGLGTAVAAGWVVTPVYGSDF